MCPNKIPASVPLKKGAFCDDKRQDIQGHEAHMCSAHVHSVRVHAVNIVRMCERLRKYAVFRTKTLPQSGTQGNNPSRAWNVGVYAPLTLN